MIINGLCVALSVLIISVPRCIYLLTKTKSSLVTKLMTFPFNLLQIISLVSVIAASVLAFFFSQVFLYFGIFFVFLVFSLLSIVTYYFYFAYFVQKGNDPFLLFSAFYKLPAPYTILTTFVIILASLTTLNFYLLIPASTFFISSFIVDYVGYKATKPNLSADPKDEYDEYK